MVLTFSLNQNSSNDYKPLLPSLLQKYFQFPFSLGLINTPTQFLNSYLDDTEGADILIHIKFQWMTADKMS